MKKKVIVVLDVEDWNLFEETLYMDSKSPAFDKELKSNLKNALRRVEVFRRIMRSPEAGGRTL